MSREQLTQKLYEFFCNRGIAISEQDMNSFVSFLILTNIASPVEQVKAPVYKDFYLDRFTGVK